MPTPAASTLTNLAAAVGEDFELFEGDDVNIIIEGGGGERDLRKSIAIDGKNLDILKLDGGELNRTRESPTSETEVERYGGDGGRNGCYRCGEEHCFAFNHIFRLTACSDPCTCYGPLTGKFNATETKRVRRRRTSLFGDVQYEANEDKVKALEGARRSGRTCIPSI